MQILKTRKIDTKMGYSKYHCTAMLNKLCIVIKKKLTIVLTHKKMPHGRL